MQSAGAYQSKRGATALSFSAHFALDLADGRINGAAFGKSTRSTLGSQTYVTRSAAADWLKGSSVFEATFSETALQDYSGDLESNFNYSLWEGLCNTAPSRTGAIISMLPYGKLQYTAAAYDPVTCKFVEEGDLNPTGSIPLGICLFGCPGMVDYPSRTITVEGVREPVGSIVMGGVEYWINLDGTMSVIGNISCGLAGDSLLGNEFSTKPRLVSGLERVVKAVAENRWIVALDTHGVLYFLGEDSPEFSRSGLEYSSLQPCERKELYRDRVFSMYKDDPPLITVGVVPRPTLITNQFDFVDLARTILGLVAITRSGDLYFWGCSKNAEPCGGRQPTRYEGLTQVRTVLSGVGLIYAVRDDGSVFAWGPNESRSLVFHPKFSGPVPRPIEFEELRGTVDLETFQDKGMAILEDGTALVWGTEGVYDGTTIVVPVQRWDNLPVVAISDLGIVRAPGPPPRPVRLVRRWYGLLFVGADGYTYQLLRDVGGKQWAWLRE